eukprot:357057-Chlamydomonas_euryale.AAC.2
MAKHCRHQPRDGPLRLAALKHPPSCFSPSSTPPLAALKHPPSSFPLTFSPPLAALKHPPFFIPPSSTPPLAASHSSNASYLLEDHSPTSSILSPPQRPLTRTQAVHLPRPARRFDRVEVDSSVRTQPLFKEPRRVVSYYAASGGSEAASASADAAGGEVGGEAAAASDEEDGEYAEEDAEEGDSKGLGFRAKPGPVLLCPALPCRALPAVLCPLCLACRVGLRCPALPCPAPPLAALPCYVQQMDKIAAPPRGLGFRV